MRQRSRHNARAALPLRLMALLLVPLAVVACGREAPPRAVVATPVDRRVPEVPTETPVAPITPAPADDPRAMGDPRAPITIVEYSDFQ